MTAVHWSTRSNGTAVERGEPDGATWVGLATPGLPLSNAFVSSATEVARCDSTSLEPFGRQFRAWFDPDDLPSDQLPGTPIYTTYWTNLDGRRVPDSTVDY